MNGPSNRFRFRLIDLFLVVTVLALIFTQLVGESLPVIGGCLFCLISVVAISILFGLSIRHLALAVHRGWRERTWLPLVARIKWSWLDAIGLVWFFAVVAVANWVLSEAQANGGRLVLAGMMLSPLVAVQILYRWPGFTGGRPPAAL